MTRSTALVTAYALAIVAANLTIAELGPAAVIPVGLLLIGATLVLRDKLHDYLGGGLPLVVGMGMLLACGGFLSYLLNRDAGPIALASVVAFTAGTVVDAVAYQLLAGRNPVVRSAGSNVPAALVDSYAFLALAFPGPAPLDLVAAQTAAKALGGLAWAAVLYGIPALLIGRQLDHHLEEDEEDRARELGIVANPDDGPNGSRLYR